MEQVIAFSEYLKVLGYDLDKLTFQEAVNLHTEVRRVISDKFENDIVTGKK